MDKKRRVVIAMTFECNLDPSPGWGHQTEDWVKLLQSQMSGISNRYNATLAIESVSTEDPK